MARMAVGSSMLATIRTAPPQWAQVVPAGAWARRVGADVPGAGDSLLALSRRFEDARYSAAPGERDALVRDLRRHRP